MTKSARYAVTFGLAGCYMPDSHLGAYEFRTRGEFIAFIKDEIEQHGFPKNTFGQANMRKRWGRIKRHGSSVQHFSIDHGSYSIGFHGLTLAEFREQEEAE
ncbi:hypothetical protein [Mesorhizobium sp. M0767]|uniref:hypothetical protein n=1 Tax=Mesorhizobium sp. M0767 TaxID=2956995 RepID=UPI0033393F6A